MADTDHIGRFVGESQNRSKRWRDFTGSGQIEITQTVDGMSTCDFAITDAVLFRERHLRSHAFKIPRQQTTRLRGGFRPMRHTHGSAGDQRGAQERSGIRQIRFDRHLPG